MNVENDRTVQRALRESIAQIELKSTDAKTQIAASETLAALGSIPSQDALKALASDATPEVAKAAVGGVG